MSTDSPVTVLTRDIEAIQIPSGLTKKLEKGTPVIITQASVARIPLSSSIPPACSGFLASDADALGKTHVEAAAANGTGKTGGPLNEEDIWTQLKTCYDPEIPVNIVDLGLIYSLGNQAAGRRRQPCRSEDDADRARLRHGALHRLRRPAEDSHRARRNGCAGGCRVGPAVERRAAFRKRASRSWGWCRSGGNLSSAIPIL